MVAVQGQVRWTRVDSLESRTKALRDLDPKQMATILNLVIVHFGF